MKKLLMVIAAIMLSATLAACANEPKGEPITSGTINVYSRDSASGTREAFMKGIGVIDEDLLMTHTQTAGNGDLAAKVGKDKYGIGYVSLSTDMAANNIKALKYNNVEATEANVLNGAYTLQRPFSYVTRAENDFSSEEVKQMTAAFIAFTETKEGMSVLRSEHVIVDDTNAPTWDSIKGQHPIINTTTDITVRMAGSTSVTKAVDATAKAFQAIVPNFKYTMDNKGSSEGYSRTLGSDNTTNGVEIGWASRGFTTSEDVSVAMATGFVGIDAVAIVVEKNNPLENMTTAQIVAIYKGTTRDWENILNK